jgi:hypothetical protein
MISSRRLPQAGPAVYDFDADQATARPCMAAARAASRGLTGALPACNQVFHRTEDRCMTSTMSQPAAIAASARADDVARGCAAGHLESSENTSPRIRAARADRRSRRPRTPPARIDLRIDDVRRHDAVEARPRLRREGTSVQRARPAAVVHGHVHVCESGGT